MTGSSAGSSAGSSQLLRPEGVDIRRANARPATRIDWLDSRHCFSFGPHYDPRNTHFGLLLVSNDDVVAPGLGFDTHPHRDMEIVTWVLDGALVHQDSEGHNGIIYPGLAQRMSAGTGILHSEKNDSWTIDGSRHDNPVHFVQMWVPPLESGIEPGYEQRDIGAELGSGVFVPVASGDPRHGDSAIRIAQPHATLWAARPGAGQVLSIPDAPFVHLFVARGAVELEGEGQLGAGDAARITGSSGRRITAGPEGAEVLVWEMHAEIRFGRG